MLERLLSRRCSASALQIMIGIVAGLLSCNFALAQFSSPAVSGVYNRAASMNGAGGGFGLAAQPVPGQNPGARNANKGGLPANTPLDVTSLKGLMGGMDYASSLLSNEPVVSESPEYVFKGHDPKEPVLSVKFVMYNNGREYKYAVLSASGDASAKLWDLDGKYDPETTEWFITSARVRKTFKDSHKQGVTKAIFSPDYSMVLTSSYDASGRLWTIKKVENIRAYIGAKDRLWSIAIAPNGQYVAAACNDGRVYFWQSLAASNKLGTLPNREDAVSQTPDSEVGHEGPVFDVAFDPNSEFAATAGADGTVRLWNLALLKQVAVFQGHTAKVYSVKFSSDGSYLLTASRDKTARLWNARTGQEVCRFIGHTGAVRQATFVNSLVCTASDDGTVRLWSTSVASKSGQRNGANGLLGNSMGGMNDDMYGDSMGMGGSAMDSSSYSAPSDPGYMGSSSMGPGATGNDPNNKKVAKPTRKNGLPKGTELFVFEADSPVFSADVSEDLVYVAGGCADGMVRVWRVPGMARYYGDYTQNSGNRNYRNGNGNYGSGSGVNYDTGLGAGLGTDPMADPSMTMPVGGGRN